MPKRIVVGVALTALATLSLGTAVRAEFRVCNNSSERASVSIGYHHDDFGWTSEGWWRVPIGECVTIIRGNLKNRYYYVYATGHRGGVWSGRGREQNGGFFCVSSAKYTYHNREYQRENVINCERRGLQTRQFRLVDTEGSENYTFNLAN